jgi:hypothetical protein
VLRVRGAVALGVAASGRYDLRDQIEFGSGQSRLDVQQRLDNKNFFFLNQGSFPELIKTAAAVGDWLREVSCFSQE